MPNARCEYANDCMVKVHISPWLQPLNSVIGTHGVYDEANKAPLVQAICQQKPKGKPCKFNRACTGLVKVEPKNVDRQDTIIRITIEKE